MTDMRSHAEGHRPQRSSALSPAGRPQALDDLPPPDTTRWVPRRKADKLSVDEFRSSERLLERHGVKGLRTTRIKAYRAG